ncbi:hypothetical protein OAE58_00715 [Akkermansiaceae bacterium]|nr:hypothetical protein [Akkermansiaceae bacterium]MDB4769757.1 hypothetical protein [bacterium]MDA7651173.1 hypothetical protein [Akkermansiaceae bacterium]MDA7931713.1 hypothetical protein [Akkermansiaceae bacterium]MDB4041192.1 hypothetical protein [Akkermansiaceae bacterium]
MTVSLNPDHSYRIEYSLDARIALVSSTMSRPSGGAITNIEYQTIALNSTAKLTDGKPLVISKLNG